MNFSDQDLNIINQAIRKIPDFPKPGVLFQDITTLLNNAQVFTMLIDGLKKHYINKNIDFIAGAESRGFIFASILAYSIGAGIVPIRKKGKLPSKTFSKTYSLEYGEDSLEIHQDAFKNLSYPKVLFIDDLLATGGTAKACLDLIIEAKAEVVGACFIIELIDLQGKQQIEDICTIDTVLKL